MLLLDGIPEIKVSPESVREEGSAKHTGPASRA